MLGMMLVAAITLAELPYEVLESFYWDCDTMFMRGEMGGEDMYTCLSITDEFKRHFKDRDAFKLYWEKNRQAQWQQRGYQHKGN